MRSRTGLKVLTVAAVATAASWMSASPAAAHNTGHLTLPSGACHQVGSSTDGPLVGQDRQQLDLVPETANPPFDEFGTSFVGFYGRTPISPGPCR